MPVPTVQLTGAAIGGIRPDMDHLKLMVAANKPISVKLGRKRRIGPIKAQLLHLAKYVDLTRYKAPPTNVDWYSKATASLQKMYLNDSEGDCVIAGKAHALGITSANDSDSGGVILATDAEIQQQYTDICGPGDNGCVITDVLDVMKSKGFLASGKLHKIDAYVACDWTNKTLVQAAIDLFGAPTIGINLPEAWTTSDVWDVTTTQIVGGHDVTCCGVNDQGVQIASWGRLYTITWAAFTARTWLEEMYCILYQSWYNNDRLAPSGVDVTALQADLAAIEGGTVPPTPGPNPPPPPPPPPPTTGFSFTTLHNRAVGQVVECLPTQGGVRVAVSKGTYATTGMGVNFTLHVRRNRTAAEIVQFKATVAMPVGTYNCLPGSSGVVAEDI